jgi:hypothetical protein
MPNLNVVVNCAVSGCFKKVELTVPVAGGLPEGWYFLKVPPLSTRPPVNVRGVCPDHAAGEISHGRVER